MTMIIVVTVTTIIINGIINVTPSPSHPTVKVAQFGLTKVSDLLID